MVLSKKHIAAFISVALSSILLCEATADQTADRALRPFYETTFVQAGMSVHVPARPEWSFSVVRNNTEATVELRTPINYYPTAVIQLTRNSRHGSNLDDLSAVALAAINESRDLVVVPRINSEAELVTIQTGDINGYQDQFTLTIDDGAYDVRNIVAVFPSGHLLTVLVSTPQGQIEHIEHMVAKILRNLKEL